MKHLLILAFLYYVFLNLFECHQSHNAHKKPSPNGKRMHNSKMAQDIE